MVENVCFMMIEGSNPIVTVSVHICVHDQRGPPINRIPQHVTRRDLIGIDDTPSPVTRNHLPSSRSVYSKIWVWQCKFPIDSSLCIHEDLLTGSFGQRRIVYFIHETRSSAGSEQ